MDGITEDEAETWGDNFDDYQSTEDPDVSFDDYRFQPVEQDAPGGGPRIPRRPDRRGDRPAAGGVAMSGSLSRADLDCLVDRLVATPGRSSYEAVRDAAAQAPGLAREVAPTALARSLDGADPATAVRELEARMPGALLSPSAHAALASALDRVGRREDAATHRSLARSAVRGMLGSGRGTRERPWRVLRVSDEYDVLRHLGRPRGQELVEENGMEIDRIVTDGDDAWFCLIAPLPAGTA